MSQDQDNNIPNILSLELQLKQKHNELLFKTKILENAQRESVKLQEQLLNKDVDLENSKRKITDLKLQLKSAHQVIELLEKEKTKYMNETLQLQIKWDTALNERESLLEQTHSARLENMTLKLDVQKLQNTILDSENQKKNLEVTLTEAKERFAQVHGILKSNIGKLEQEQKFIQTSVESITQLNNRLLTVGLCTHAIYARKNKEIELLQEELASKAYNYVPERAINVIMDSNITKGAKEALEEISRFIETESEADKELQAIITQYQQDVNDNSE